MCVQCGVSDYKTVRETSAASYKGWLAGSLASGIQSKSKSKSIQEQKFKQQIKTFENVVRLPIRVAIWFDNPMARIKAKSIPKL